MSLSLLSLVYFGYIIIKKLINRVFVTTIIFQYMFLSFLIYIAAIFYFDTDLLVVLGGGVLFLFIARAIRSIFRSRYLIVNTSYEELVKIIEGFGIKCKGAICSFNNGNQFRIRRNFEGIIVDFFEYSADNRVNRDNLFNAIRQSRVVRSKSWYVDMALSLTICVFIIIYLFTR
ncbi:hypothetical protein IMX26_04620 [Clostridium sp. 'deep sea']|uniref:hypothetical protein n=1 Tax=Clostridium sp. 'deep sea' TaxID=2779445 RepID=UPI0018965C63|nr:hypothetical protein [Clostridium sp. 'deep sea']QOR36103.1 hypothetical protein IMX26_04620 [Clostridium sp. 'deep sea']